MQTPPQKQTRFHFLIPNCCAMFWNKWKINFSIFFSYDRLCSQFPCVFTDQKWRKKCLDRYAMFWNGWKINLAVFRVWVIFDFVTILMCFYRPKMEKKNIVSKIAQSFETMFWVHEFFFVRFLVFELWSISYFTFVMHSGLRRT